jgi:DNA-binding response OmpR family regulator
MTDATPPQRAFAGLSIDDERREVRVHDRSVALSALEFDLLTALSAKPGQVLSRRQLLERVWGFDFFGDERVVDVHIRNLRRALGDDADSPTWIATVRGVGYKFVEVVA